MALLIRTLIVMAAALSLATILGTGAFASGSYLPPNVHPPVSDLLYGLGKAIYSGEVKIGTGQTCSGCHRGSRALKKANLRAMKVSLEQQIHTCATRDDRVRGKLDNTQMEALVRFIRKRYRL
jgi:hypothetical protein